jgi:hypothetical protein
MPAFCIETTDKGQLFWYKQSALLMHNNRLFAIHHENYLAEYALRDAFNNKISVVLTYPQVPFCPSHYLLQIKYIAQESLSDNMVLFFPVDDISGDDMGQNTGRIIIGRSVLFYPMRKLPGDYGYIPHIAGRSRDFLTPRARIVLYWMRDIARKRLTAKRMALAMGLHARLGEGSPLLQLGDDIVWALALSKFPQKHSN